MLERLSDEMGGRMNRIEAVADIFGLKVYEEFDINKVIYDYAYTFSKAESLGRFRFTYAGLEKYDSDKREWVEPEVTIFNCLLKGAYDIKKHVLTLKEKSYLEHMISPYEKYVKTFEKQSCKIIDQEFEYIQITTNDGYDEDKEVWTHTHLLPPGKMFKFMKLGKKYKKFQLELEKWED